MVTTGTFVAFVRRHNSRLLPFAFLVVQCDGDRERFRAMTFSNNMAESSPREREGEGGGKIIEQQREKCQTPYERLTYDLAHEPRYLKEITMGKRIGFYRIRGELGSGNFCQVKMGIHSLTRGEKIPCNARAVGTRIVIR